MQKIINGSSVEFNEEGFLTQPEVWSKELALEIAKEINISLTDAHWKVIEYIRGEYAKGAELTIRKVGTSGIVDIKQFYILFPNGPLKNACRIAGLPKPHSCL